VTEYVRDRRGAGSTTHTVGALADDIWSTWPQPSRGRHVGRGTPSPGRDLLRHREADHRGLRAAEGHHGGRLRRDRGDRLPWRRDARSTVRVHRPRRAHQRPAPRPYQ
jgi:hypothetical protein